MYTSGVNQSTCYSFENEEKIEFQVEFKYFSRPLTEALVKISLCADIYEGFFILQGSRDWQVDIVAAIVEEHFCVAATTVGLFSKVKSLLPLCS